METNELFILASETVVDDFYQDGLRISVPQIAH